MTLPTITATKSDIRRLMIKGFYAADDFLFDTPVVTTTSAVYSSPSRVNSFPDQHFTGGSLMAFYADGTSQLRRVTAWDSSTATATINSAFTGSPTSYLMTRSGVELDIIDACIERAIWKLAQKLYVDSVDDSIRLQRGRKEYPLLPTWSHIEEVEISNRRVTGDRHTVEQPDDLLYLSGAGIYYQPFTIEQPIELRGLSALLQLVDPTATTYPTANIYLQTASAPGAAVATAVGISDRTTRQHREKYWADFEFTTLSDGFSRSLILDPGTYYVGITLGSNARWFYSSQSSTNIGTVYGETDKYAHFALTHQDGLFVKLNPGQWRVLQKSAALVSDGVSLVFDDYDRYPSGTQLRVTGQAAVSTLSLETSVVTVNPEVVLQTAMHLLYNELGATDKTMASAADRYEKSLEKTLAQYSNYGRGKTVRRY
mgnify:CR=1 FL=1